MTGDVQCAEHGAQPATYVCQHLVLSLRDYKPRGFVCESDGESDYPDAWCDECDRMLIAGGGEWTDDLGKAAGVQLLCASCYCRVRKLNGLSKA